MLVPLEPPRRDIHFSNLDVRFDITPADGKAWNARVVKLKNDLAKCVQIIDNTRAAFEKCEGLAYNTVKSQGYNIDGETAWRQFKQVAQGKPLPKADPFLIEVSTEAEKVANLMYKARNGTSPIHGIDSSRIMYDYNPKLYSWLQKASEELERAYRLSNTGWQDVFGRTRNGHLLSGYLRDIASVIKNVLRAF